MWSRTYHWSTQSLIKVSVCCLWSRFVRWYTLMTAEESLSFHSPAYSDFILLKREIEASKARSSFTGSTPKQDLFSTIFLLASLSNHFRHPPSSCIYETIYTAFLWESSCLKTLVNNTHANLQVQNCQPCRKCAEYRLQPKHSSCCPGICQLPYIKALICLVYLPSPN